MQHGTTKLSFGLIRKHAVSVIFFALCLVAIIRSQYMRIPFISEEGSDGFRGQVYYVQSLWAGGVSIFNMEPLLWIHSIRALIATFFIWIEEDIGNGARTATILLLSIPLLKVFSKLPRGYLVFVLPFAIMAISERTFLAMMAIAYLLLFMRGGGADKFYLVVSFILTNLSSGAVLNCLIISTIVVRNHRPRSVSLYIYIAALLISFGISLSDKYQGFTEQSTGYESSAYGTSSLGSLLSRSTLLVSAMEGDYVRVAVYGFLAVLAVALFIFALFSRNHRGYVPILIAALQSLIAEGLGFVSMLVPILLFLAGAQLTWSRSRDKSLHAIPPELAAGRYKAA